MRRPILYVDCRCLQDPAFRKRGVGQHSAALLRTRFASPLRDLQSIGLIDPQLPPLCPDISTTFDKVTVAVNPTFGPRAIFLDLSPMTHSPRLMSRFIGHPALFKASVVYDFIPYDWPGYLTSVGQRIEYLSSLAILKTASRFFPISLYSAKRLQDLLGVQEAQLVTTGAAVRSSLYDLAARHGSLSPTINLREGYFVTLGGSDSRKNTGTAVTAMVELRRRTSRNYRLIVIGDYTEEQKSTLVKTNPDATACIEFRTNISDGDLAGLYRHAIASIAPSHIEGFSLPVVESAIVGCPVLASSCAAHAELLADVSALFPSTQPLQLAAKLERMVTDDAWRALLLTSQAGIGQRFHERLVGERFWDGLAAAFESTGVEAPRVAMRAKPRIALLSPYPPDPSGVARFSYATVRSLGKLADVDIFTDALRPLNLPVGTRDAGRITPVPYQSSRYDSVVAVLGNSHFHYPILDLFDRYGGPCILHDSRLTHAYYRKVGEKMFIEMASRFLGREVDPAEIGSWLEDKVAPTLFVDRVLERASPLIVHTQPYARLLEERYGFQAEVAPFPPNQEFAEEELSQASRRAARERLGIPPGRVVLSHFGYLVDTKDIDTCIRSLQWLRDGGIDAHLYLIGDSTGYKLDAEAPEDGLHIRSFVHCFDSYIDEHTYRDYLLATDVAVQLRTYDLGQPSAALADCIGAGIPTVANESLAAACEAPAFVHRVPDGSTGQAVAEAIGYCVTSPRPLAIARRRHEYLQTHNFDAYARRLMQALALSSIT